MFVAAQESGEPFLLALGHYAVGLAWDYRGDLDQAAAAYAGAISMLRSAGYEAHAWVIQAYLATTLVLRGDLESGVPMLDEALTRLREISSDWFVVLAIAQRAHAALRQGDLPGAARWFTETVDFAQNLQLMGALFSAVTGLAGVALALGQADRAARVLGAVESAREAIGLEHIQDMHDVEHINATIRAGLETAEFERAWVEGHRMSLEDAVAEALAIADGLLTEAKG
jgi:tetratricopeptide (TPR) repeat protein